MSQQETNAPGSRQRFSCAQSGPTCPPAETYRASYFSRTVIQERVTKLADLVSLARRDLGQEIEDCVLFILRHVDSQCFVQHSKLLLESCFFFFRVGRTHQGILIATEVARRAKQFGDIQAERRIQNILGVQYTDIADFPSAMQSLQLALTLATKIGDPTTTAACLANVMNLMQEMGHYRQAIAMGESVFELKSDSPNARLIKLQCSANGLFASHRVGDYVAAAQFLVEGQKHLPYVEDPLSRAFFEKDRAIYLIQTGQVDLAAEFVRQAMESPGNKCNPRVEVLLGISDALCKWAGDNKEEGRFQLKRMYAESKESRLYHHFVLQSLVKAFSDGKTLEEVETGMGYARELVEYTTSVKRAKFYRQLTKRKAATHVDLKRPLESTDVDPFVTMRDWLSATHVDDADVAAGERRELAKHEELTAIHEDMAKLRAASLRREIRTDAVGTAENWAIAAELFDDETGKHCYRVGHLAGMLAREIGMNDTFCVQVEHAARLHDIGKIAVNEVILLKPGPLDSSEMAAMRLHTEVGAQMLAGSDDPTLKMAVEIARHHHEWWNGGGYPKRLSGRDIPMSARVCAFADVYDALTHVRAYKTAWSHERALDEILRLRGVQFDPDMIDPFVKLLDRYLADLDANAIPGFADMDSNALISSRRKLMETIAAGNK